MRGARDLIERLLQSIADQSVGDLYALVNEVETLLVDCFRTGLENAYARSQLAFPCILTHMYRLGTAFVAVQSPAHPCGNAGSVIGTSPSTPIPRNR